MNFIMGEDCNSGECTSQEPGKGHKHKMTEEHSHEDGHSHDGEDAGSKSYLPVIISLCLLIAGILFNYNKFDFFNKHFQWFFFGTAYVLVGGPVLTKAAKEISKGNIFNEFFLMGIATIGAFAIGSYEEGVAVMLFYTVGELFQDAAVNRAKRSIKALLEIPSEELTIVEDGKISIKHPKEVAVGEVVQIKSGEKLALDGELLSVNASFNTSALTGESVPETKRRGEPVFAGMINLNTLSEIKVTHGFQDTKLSKILALVQDAIGRKARTQQFISKFARVYTPIVVFMAIGLTLLPWFLIDDYEFKIWLYRALIFLVISCPCALVISIPLGYFGGIGAASQNGILFKGSNYLDLIKDLDTVVMDKTGTLTKGVFKVQQVKVSDFDEGLFLKITAAVESKSNHPIAKAITEHVKDFHEMVVSDVEEISGHGLKGRIDKYEVLAGSARLLKKFSISYDPSIDNISETIVVVAIDKRYAGFITIADEIKDDALEAISNLRQLGVKKIVMLSGDKQSVVDKVSETLGIDEAYGELFPEDKTAKLIELKRHSKALAFVGDGVNDAPVVALADVGIAMGGLGSDATIESADVVIQTDQPSRVAMAVKIGRATHHIIWQNISLAFGVKAIVLILGAVGIATMWEAVFADVGVALLAILNAVRIQKMKF
jgi:Zn2+/Cd2+-exporting ATPase